MPVLGQACGCMALQAAWSHPAAVGLCPMSVLLVSSIHTALAPCVLFLQGKWTSGEDTRLMELVEEKGRKWKEIGGALGRMPESCRDRWLAIRCVHAD